MVTSIEQVVRRQTTQASWRKLDGQNQLPKIIDGIKFTDGIEANHDHAAA